MPTVLINVRLDSKIVETLKTIACGKGERHLSNIIREALLEYIATYTGEPTLKSLQRKTDEIDVRLRKVEDKIEKVSQKEWKQGFL
jgi:hypothetical protein